MRAFILLVLRWFSALICTGALLVAVVFSAAQLHSFLEYWFGLENADRIMNSLFVVVVLLGLACFLAFFQTHPIAQLDWGAWRGY